MLQLHRMLQLHTSSCSPTPQRVKLFQLSSTHILELHIITSPYHGPRVLCNNMPTFQWELECCGNRTGKYAEIPEIVCKYCSTGFCFLCQCFCGINTEHMLVLQCVMNLYLDNVHRQASATSA